MNDEHVAAYRRCSQAGDIDGLARTLAADVQLISPLSDRMTFRGERDVRLVLAVVYRTLRDWRWTAVAADGDRRVLVGEGFIGPLRLGDAMVVDLDDAGRIRRLRPHLRPLAGACLFLLALATKLSRHPGLLRRAAGTRCGPPVRRR